MSNNPNSNFSSTNPDHCFTLVQEEKISLSDLYLRAHRLSLRLPEGRYAINLCRNRYLFTLGYLAVLIRKQITLLPQNQSRGCISKILNEYSGSFCISDDPNLQYPSIVLDFDDSIQNGPDNVLRIPDDRIASISFTSGSTGMPKAIPKRFGEFLKSARLATERLGILNQDIVMVSTVPPQHMYGLETSVYWPIVAAKTIHSTRPFFPEDIRRTICAMHKPCLLISTPSHLKACVESTLRWTNLAGVLSSTACMPLALAKSIEKRFDAPLFEIFGSTETLSFASRRLTISDKWKPYRGVQVGTDQEKYTVQGGHLSRPLPIDDRLCIDSDGCFSLTGRSSDLVKIGGKRASIAELNRLINEIEGVRDGLFYLTEHGRLGALVVSRRSKQSILDELRQSIDEVFIPRPFHRIDEIPRNETGKIVKLKLDRLIRDLNIA